MKKKENKIREKNQIIEKRIQLMLNQFSIFQQWL